MDLLKYWSSQFFKASLLFRTGSLLLFAMSCGEKKESALTSTPRVETETPVPTKPVAAEIEKDPKVALIETGLKVYRRNCISCHNKDPRQDGSQGPDVWGSSLELLRLRILETKYPAGYKPKRDTNKMLKLPFLKNQIEALHAYLNS